MYIRGLKILTEPTMTFIMAVHLPHSQLMPVRVGGIFDSNKTNGLWSISESSQHVNVQELKAILSVRMAFVSQIGLHKRSPV